MEVGDMEANSPEKDVGLWLVEIRLKDWRPSLPSGSRIVAFEEVLARDQISARHVGFDKFERRAMYEPATRLMLSRLSLPITDCCAPDAVKISY